MKQCETETPKIKKAPRKKRAPDINPADFLSAVGLVIEKEGHVNTLLLREHFYRDHGKSAIKGHLRALVNDGVLEYQGKGSLVFSKKPGNGNGREQPTAVLPPPKPLANKSQAKALPEPANGNQPHAELRSLVARAIDRLEEFQERYQPLLASLLDLEKDMEAFEQLTALLGNIKTLARTGLREIRPVGTGWRN